MKKKNQTLQKLTSANKREIISNKQEMERIERKLDERHQVKLASGSNS